MHYTEILCKLVSSERLNTAAENETELVVRLLADLFPYFGQRIGKTYEVYDRNQLIRNNQIAHPDKFNRYFQLDIDSIAYRTADVINVTQNFDEHDIVFFLLKQEENGTSYEFLEDIKARITELSAGRAKVLICALLKSIKDLNKIVRKSWFSLNSSYYAEIMILDLIEQIPAKERLTFVSELISQSDMDIIQSIAPVINMIELGYGRLAAEGKEKNYKKVITLDELSTVETIFTNRAKEILKSSSLFDFSEWHMVYYLLNSFEPEYTKHYLKSSLTKDKSILQFLGLFVAIWTGSGTEYEIQTGYDEYFSTERALSAIEACKKNRTILELPEELQHKCAAFFLANSGNKEYSGHIYQFDTEKIIASWRM